MPYALVQDHVDTEVRRSNTRARVAGLTAEYQIGLQRLVRMPEHNQELHGRPVIKHILDPARVKIQMDYTLWVSVLT